MVKKWLNLKEVLFINDFTIALGLVHMYAGWGPTFAQA